MIRRAFNFLVPFSILSFLFISLRGLQFWFNNPFSGGLMFWVVAIIALTVGFTAFSRKRHTPLLLILAGVSSIFPLNVTVLGGYSEFVFSRLTSAPALFFFLCAVIFPPMLAWGGVLRHCSKNNSYPLFTAIAGGITGLIFSYLFLKNGNIVPAAMILLIANVLAGIAALVFRMDKKEPDDFNYNKRSGGISPFLITVFTVFYVYSVYRILVCKFTGFIPLYFLFAFSLLLLVLAGSVIFRKTFSRGVWYLLTGFSVFASLFFISYLSGIFANDFSGGQSLFTIFYGYKILPFIFSIPALLPLAFLIPAAGNGKEFRPERFINILNMSAAILSVIAAYYLIPLIGSILLITLLGCISIAFGIMNIIFGRMPWRTRIIIAGAAVVAAVTALVILPDRKPEFIFKNLLHGNPVTKVVSFSEGKESSVMSLLDRGNRPRISVNGAMAPLLTKRAAIMSGVLSTLYHRLPVKALSLSYLYPEDTEGLLLSPDIADVTILCPDELYIKTISEGDTFGKTVYLSDDRVDFRQGNARFFLRDNAEEKYDIIVNSALEPWSRPDFYYTSEFLGLLKGRLNRGGIVAQRINAMHINKEQFIEVIATMKSVFREVSVWSYFTKDIIVLCSDSPFVTDINRMEFIPSSPGSDLNNALVNIGLFSNGSGILDGFRGSGRDFVSDSGPLRDSSSALDMSLLRDDYLLLTFPFDVNLIELKNARLNIYGIFMGRLPVLVSPQLGMKVNLSDNWRIYSAGLEFNSVINENAPGAFSARPFVSLRNSSNKDSIDAWLIPPQTYKIPEDAVKDYSVGELVKKGEGDVDGHTSSWYFSKTEDNTYHLTTAWECDKNNGSFFAARYESANDDWEEAGKMLVAHLRCYHAEPLKTPDKK